jgi:hypothetical protein
MDVGDLMTEFDINREQEMFRYGKNNAWTMALEEGKKEISEDMVNSPNHYASSNIECIDAMEAMMDQGRPPMVKMTGHMYYCWSTIFKYIWRWPFKKNPVEDLKKAEYYIKRLIERLESAD